MIRSSAIDGIPASLALMRISFIASNGNLINFKESSNKSERSFVFGYLWDGGETRVSKSGVIIEEHANFKLETRSMIWRMAEIKVERQNEWLIFSRTQDDLSVEALLDFLIDSRNYLDHLRDEDKRFNPA